MYLNKVLGLDNIQEKSLYDVYQMASQESKTFVDQVFNTTSRQMVMGSSCSSFSSLFRPLVGVQLYYIPVFFFGKQVLNYCCLSPAESTQTTRGRKRRDLSRVSYASLHYSNDPVVNAFLQGVKYVHETASLSDLLLMNNRSWDYAMNKSLIDLSLEFQNVTSEQFAVIHNLTLEETYQVSKISVRVLNDLGMPTSKLSISSLLSMDSSVISKSIWFVLYFFN